MDTNDKIKETDTNIKETVTGKETVSEKVRISPRTGKPIEKKFSPKYKNGVKKKYPNKSKNGKNSPMIGMNGYNLKAGDNTNVMMINIALFNMPDIDMDNVEEVNKRLGEYFALYAKYDYKPTVAGMALALNGMSRQTLQAIVAGLPTGGSGYKSPLPFDVADCIKKAYKMMENMWETYMNSGKINPVSGIFLGKNNYGYQDKSEYVLTPNTNPDDEYSAEDIKARYINQDHTKKLLDNSEE